MINFQFLIFVLKASHHELVCNSCWWSRWSLSWFTLDMDLRPVFGGKHKRLCSLPDYTKLYCSFRSALLLSIRCRKLGLTCKILVLLKYFKIFVPIQAAQSTAKTDTYAGSCWWINGR